MLNVVRIWILLSTLLVLSGWTLSAFNELNRVGYGWALVLGALGWFFWRQKTNWHPAKNFPQLWCKFQKRFRRPAPMLFLALLLMSLIGGLLYIPINGDSNSYRIPRILHWLGQQQWHWIHTLDERMNIAGCGFEWLAAPVVLFTHSDRYIFLVNWAAYSMLPGLIFSVFSRLQISPRVCWWWAWILPAGWCYAMQAASDVNDSFAVIYALAAVDFGLRAAKNKSTGDFWLCILATALLTGTKQTIIPLALLGLIAAWKARGLLLSRPLATALILAVAVMVSGLPLAWLNWKHTGNWLGIPAHLTPTSPIYGTVLDSPFWGIVGNLYCIPVRNLEPPICPRHPLDHEIVQLILTSRFGAHFKSFEVFGDLPPALSETNAGIGLGVCILTAATLAALKYRGWFNPIRRIPRQEQIYCWLFLLVPLLLLLVFMSQVGTRQNVRQLAPYYVFLFPLILVNPANTLLVRRRWWRWLALFTMLFTVALIITSRSRPLFPAQTMIAAIESRFPHAKFISKNFDSFFYLPMVEQYRTFIAQTLPPGEKVIGYATDWGGMEPPMWLPVGSRRVERVLPGDTREILEHKGIHYVYVDTRALGPPMPPKTIAQWMAEGHASLVASYSSATNRVAQENRLYLVRLQAAEPTNAVPTHQ